MYLLNTDLTKSTKDFPRQILKRFTFRVKSNDSIFFLLGNDNFAPHPHTTLSSLNWTSK